MKLMDCAEPEPSTEQSRRECRRWWVRARANYQECVAEIEDVRTKDRRDEMNQNIKVARWWMRKWAAARSKASKP